jgi:hypothetical protein
VVAVHHEHLDACVGQSSKSEQEPSLCARIAIGIVVHVAGQNHEVDLLGNGHVDESIEGFVDQRLDPSVGGVVDGFTEALEWSTQVQIGGVEKFRDGDDDRLDPRLVSPHRPAHNHHGAQMSHCSHPSS